MTEIHPRHLKLAGKMVPMTRSEEVEHIKCPICRILVNESLRLLENVEPLDMEVVEDMLDDVCSPSTAAGRWLKTLDLWQLGKKIHVTQRVAIAECRQECSVAQSACKQLVKGRVRKILQAINGKTFTVRSFCGGVCERQEACASRRVDELFRPSYEDSFYDASDLEDRLLRLLLEPNEPADVGTHPSSLAHASDVKLQRSQEADVVNTKPSSLAREDEPTLLPNKSVVQGEESSATNMSAIEHDDRSSMVTTQNASNADGDHATVSRHDEIKHVKCQVCKLLLKSAKRLLAVHTALNSSYELEDAVDRLCSVKHAEGIWLRRLDLQTRGTRIRVVEQDAFGICGRECSIAQQACESILENHEEELLREIVDAGEDSGRESMCTRTCERAPKALHGNRIDETFRESSVNSVFDETSITKHQSKLSDVAPTLDSRSNHSKNSSDSDRQPLPTEQIVDTSEMVIPSRWTSAFNKIIGAAFLVVLSIIFAVVFPECALLPKVIVVAQNCWENCLTWMCDAKHRFGPLLTTTLKHIWQQRHIMWVAVRSMLGKSIGSLLVLLERGWTILYSFLCFCLERYTAGVDISTFISVLSLTHHQNCLTWMRDAKRRVGPLLTSTLKHIWQQRHVMGVAVWSVLIKLSGSLLVHLEHGCASLCSFLYFCYERYNAGSFIQSASNITADTTEQAVHHVDLDASSQQRTINELKDALDRLHMQDSTLRKERETYQALADEAQRREETLNSRVQAWKLKAESNAELSNNLQRQLDTLSKQLAREKEARVNAERREQEIILELKRERASFEQDLVKCVEARSAIEHAVQIHENTIKELRDEVAVRSRELEMERDINAGMARSLETCQKNVKQLVNDACDESLRSSLRFEVQREIELAEMLRSVLTQHSGGMPPHRVEVVEVTSVGFTHDTIAQKFRDGRFVHEMVEDLEAGRLDPRTHANLLLDVVRYKNGLRSLNNRRLWALQEHQRQQTSSSSRKSSRRLPKPVMIRARIFDLCPITARFMLSNTTCTGGTSIDIRRSVSRQPRAASHSLVAQRKPAGACTRSVSRKQNVVSSEVATQPSSVCNKSSSRKQNVTSSEVATPAATASAVAERSMPTAMKSRASSTRRWQRSPADGVANAGDEGKKANPAPKESQSGEWELYQDPSSGRVWWWHPVEKRACWHNPNS
eukprot:TRINITY_DN5103_c0_g1_i1.p1 TRINITY_DN5103_c0_g1~~TRINITY_DN5103_c0_g1_i1.p1  ORF type:complete len:1273 (-),score=147.61 TRINITY_DN5103_c0_g1_i1:140-3658(-)